MRNAFLGLGAVALLVTATAVPAHAVDPQGRKCRFVSQQDPVGGAQTGEADGGPVVVAGVGAATVTCTVYVNGTARASVSGNPVAAGTVAYAFAVGDVLALCTSITYGGHTYHWQPGPYASGQWSETFDVNRCSYFGPADPNPLFCPPLLTVDKYAGTDLAGIWQDCEPYGPIV